MTESPQLQIGQTVYWGKLSDETRDEVKVIDGVEWWREVQPIEMNAYTVVALASRGLTSQEGSDKTLIKMRQILMPEGEIHLVSLKLKNKITKNDLPRTLIISVDEIWISKEECERDLLRLARIVSIH